MPALGTRSGHSLGGVGSGRAFEGCPVEDGVFGEDGRGGGPVAARLEGLVDEPDAEGDLDLVAALKFGEFGFDGLAVEVFGCVAEGGPEGHDHDIHAERSACTDILGDGLMADPEAFAIRGIDGLNDLAADGVLVEDQARLFGG